MSNIRDHLRLIGIIGSNINPEVFEHTQNTADNTWYVNHQLHTGALQVWCYDEEGNRFEPAFKVIDENNIEIYVNPAIQGIAYIFGLDVIQL